MAAKQTRGCVSFSRSIYAAAKEAAEVDGVPLAVWVERLILKALPGLQQPEPRRAVPASFCAVCTSDHGPFYAAPLGANDAIVAACETCLDGHPRNGRYTFSGGRTTGTEVRLGRDSLRNVTGSAAQRSKS